MNKGEMKDYMIPKIIHYCWFGNNKKSKLITRCIKSWHEFCPDYEIIEWNESNFDVNCCEYVRQAYEQKKWGFVSDYVRFFVINQMGGIYVDTDVQFVKPIDDLLDSKFAGFAHDNVVATGLIFAATADDWLCQKVLASYEGQQFVWDIPTKMLAIGERVTNLLVEEGLELNGKQQVIRDYIIYPEYFFNSTNGDMHAKADERAYSIHHYTATWFPKGARFRNTVKRFLGHGIMDKYYSVKKEIKKVKK